MRSYLLELKSVCKSFKFIVIILLLFSYQAMLFAQFQVEKEYDEIYQTRINTFYASRNNSWVRFWGRHYNYFMEHGVPRSIYPFPVIENDYAWHQYEKQLADDIFDAYVNEDWASYNRNMAAKNFLEWNMYTMIRPGTITPAEYFQEDWEHIKALLDQPHFKAVPFWTQERAWTNRSPEQAIFSTTFYIYLLEHDLPPPKPHSTTAWGFTFNFLRRGLPNILGAMVLLMTVTLIHRDKNFGSIKSSLQLPRSRDRYLLRKVSLGFVSSFFVILVPQVLTFLLLGIRKGFYGANSPVLLDNGLLSWSHSPDHILYTLSSSSFFEFGLSRYQRSWNAQYAALERLEIIPLWQFLGIALISIAMFILFCVVLGILISILVKNEIIAQITAIGIFVLGTAVGITTLSTTSWDIFSKADVIAILEGAHHSTYLNSILILAVATTVTFAIGAFIFRRQDIKSN